MSKPPLPTPPIPGSADISDVPVAVIGSGYWGRNLTRNFSRIGVLKAVCDADTTVLAEIEQQIPGVAVTSRLDDVLNRTDIAAVAIATPAETHAGLIRKAFGAGKHVFVENRLFWTKRKAAALKRKRPRGDSPSWWDTSSSITRHFWHSRRWLMGGHSVRLTISIPTG
jgi:hypothetical protein